MLNYIIAFSLYTLAMIGIFFIAFVVYKKTINFNGPRQNEGMKIEDMLRLSQRKSLYIINVQNERFLIASDLENTTFLAKLAPRQISPQNEQTPEQAQPQSMSPLMQTLAQALNNQTAKTSNMEKNILSSFYHPKKANNTTIEPKVEVKKPHEEESEKLEKYIKELEALNSAIDSIENKPPKKEEEEYSNAVDIKSRNAIMKNILKELEHTTKRTNI